MFIVFFFSGNPCSVHLFFPFSLTLCRVAGQESIPAGFSASSNLIKKKFFSKKDRVQLGDDTQRIHLVYDDSEGRLHKNGSRNSAPSPQPFRIRLNDFNYVQHMSGSQRPLSLLVFDLEI